jgi:hypothetical protein
VAVERSLRQAHRCLDIRIEPSPASIALGGGGPLA